MTEQADSPRNPEHISAPGAMDGLHGRFVLADQSYLRPDDALQPETATTTASFEQRNYDPFEKASVKDRSNYWAAKPETTFDAQYASWSTSLVSSFANPASHETLVGLSPVLQKSGILAQGEDAFTADHAKKLYDRYFSSSDGVKKFVKDVLDTHQNSASLTQNMKHIHWISNIFGEQGKDMVKELTVAETRLKQEPDFVKKLTENPQNDPSKMRINDLGTKEEAILRFITEAQATPLPTPRPGETRPGETPPGTEEEEDEEQAPDHYSELPMWKYKDQIQDMIRNNPRSILIGGTGTGKTKETPKFIREMLEPGEMLVVTEPTQINVESLAKKISEEEGVSEEIENEETGEKKLVLGKKIGFQHGGDRAIDDANDTRFMTEGTLLQQIRSDKRIPKIRYLMIDEVHVRSKNTEQLIALALEAQRLREEDIRNGKPGVKPLTILFTSATVDQAELERKCRAKSLVVPAAERKYSITPHYETRDVQPRDKPARAAQIIKEIIESGKSGDICEAVASIKDIDEYAKAIEALGLDVAIHKVHTNSTDEAKAEVNRKRGKNEKRRVMIGTNFIQTGVTMPNLKHIINSGEQIVMKVDSKTGLTYAKREKQTKAEIAQWDGRVGRVSSGDVYNLFTESDSNSREGFPDPEMKRSDLTDLVLQIKARKEKDVMDYDFLSSPLDGERIAFANESLRILGALKPDGTLNEIGERMVDLTTNFHYARMIVEAEREGKGVKQVCTIASMSEGSSSIFANRNKAMNAFKNYQSDFLTYVAIWKSYEQVGNDEEAKKKWCTDNGINYPAMQKVAKARERLLDRANNKDGPDASDEELGRYITSGFQDKVMQYDPTRSNATRSAYRWMRGHANDVMVYIDRDSAVPNTSTYDYIISASNGEVQVNNRTGEKYVYISNNQIVKSEWLATP